MTAIKRSVFTERAPAPIGPYQQGVVAGGFIFVSGQIPLDPQSGQVVGEKVEVQTDRVIRNIKAILEAAGSHLADVVKTTIYLQSMADFPKVNEVYAQFFEQNPPARATVEVSRLPKNVLVEIDAIAFRAGVE